MKKAKISAFVWIRVAIELVLDLDDEYKGVSETAGEVIELPEDITWHFSLVVDLYPLDDWSLGGYLRQMNKFENWCGKEGNHFLYYNVVTSESMSSGVFMYMYKDTECMYMYKDTVLLLSLKSEGGESSTATVEQEQNAACDRVDIESDQPLGEWLF